MNFFFLFLAQAKVSPDEIGLKNPITDANVALGNVLNTVYLWAGITAVIAIVIAGVLYTSSAGNPSHTRRARETIIYAVAGLVVVIMAFAITQLVLRRVG